MVVRITSLHERPLSEYLWFYHRSRQSHPFLYYCRGCVRNFEAKERVATCPKCGQTSVVELPKMTTRRNRPPAKRVRPGWQHFLRQLGQTRLQLAQALLKARLAAYYFLG